MVLIVVVRNVGNRVKVVLISGLNLYQRTRVLKRPDNNVKACSYYGFYLCRRHNGFVLRAAGG